MSDIGAFQDDIDELALSYCDLRWLKCKSLRRDFYAEWAGWFCDGRSEQRCDDGAKNDDIHKAADMSRFFCGRQSALRLLDE